MRSRACALPWLLLGGLANASCAAMDPPPRPSFRVALLVEGDPGHPIEGASVVRGKQVVATTRGDGRAELTLNGEEGATVDAEVKCPAGHQSPPRPVPMRLTRVDGRAPEFKVSCPPTQRHVVVAILAENGPRLPVVYLGNVIARTDASGAAHFVVDAAPGTQFNVTLDTSENAKLKPPSPSKPFTVGQTDELFLFDQKFEVEKKKVVFVKKEGPRCLTCGRGGS